MKVTKKEPEIEAIEFTGKNFDEIKKLVPHLEKFERKGYDYTVGWRGMNAIGEGFTEALPGFFIVKEFNGEGPEDDKYFILEPQEFKKIYQ